MMKKIFQGMILMLAIPDLTSIACADSISVHDFINQPSKEKFLVRVEIGHTKMAIPRNYLVVGIHIGGTVVVRGIATFPEFMGAGKENVSDFDMRRSFRNHDFIHFVSASSKTWGNYNKYVLNRENVALDHRNEFGLFVAQNQPAHTLSNVYFLPPSRDFSGIVITCGKKGGIKGMCWIYKNTTSDVVFYYEYQESNLSAWSQIDSGMVRLFSSFVAEDGKYK